jgi:RNA polymerase sigma-70 factor (ECF subfamily)
MGNDSQRNRETPLSPGRSPAHRQDTPVSLLERLRGKDEAAWRRLLDLFGPLVHFWCRRLGLQEADVEDMTQEVFATAAAHLESFHRDKPGDTFRGWLRAITRNQVLMHFRRIQGRAQAEGGSDALRNLEAVAESVAETDCDEREESGRTYLRALEQVRCQFEARTWQAFWLTAVESRAPAELADELGMSPVAIRQAKSRVLRRLKQELGELFD